MRIFILSRSKIEFRLRRWHLKNGTPKFETALVACGRKSHLIVDRHALVRRQGMDAFFLARQVLEQQVAVARSSGERLVVFADPINPRRLSAIVEAGTWEGLIAMLVLSFPEIYWLFDGFWEERGNELIYLSDEEIKTLRPDSLGGHYGSSRGQSDDAGGTLATSGRFVLSEHCWPLDWTCLSLRQPLFDPTGLRSWVRELTNETFRRMERRLFEEGNHTQGANINVGKETVAGMVGVHLDATEVLVVRRQRAAAIDEETDFALLHALAAYRNGWRAEVVDNWSLMEHLFHDSGVESGKHPSPHGFELIFEDMRLAFADKPARKRLSRLGPRDNGDHKNRSAFCNRLGKDEASKLRVLVTTGQEGSDRELVEDNFQFLKAKKKPGRGELVFKPVGPMSELWRKAGLFGIEDQDWIQPDGKAMNFKWPPVEERLEFSSGHGAPPKLQVIATSLLDRAAKINAQAVTTSDFVTAATLAIDAAELLSGRTPGETKKALRLKHMMEIRAEYSFLGAGYQFDLKTRFRELYAELDAVTQYHHAEKKWQVSLDTKAAILNELTNFFRSAGQVEEEQRCLVELRKVNRKLTRPNGWSAFNPLAWGLHGLLVYCEWAVGSFGRILGALFCYVLLTSLLGIVVEEIPAIASGERFGWDVILKRLPTWAQVFSDGFFTALGAESQEADTLPKDPSQLQQIAIFAKHCLSWIVAFFGLLHVSLLGSYLYSLVGRK